MFTSNMLSLFWVYYIVWVVLIQYTRSISIQSTCSWISKFVKQIGQEREIKVYKLNFFYLRKWNLSKPKSWTRESGLTVGVIVNST